MSNITRNAIVNSFKLIAAKKEIKDITIQEITANCGLKRQTFYNYFQDKYDLIKWMYLNEVVLKIEQDDTWIEKYKELFNYCLTNKNMVLNIYNCEAQNYLLHFITRHSKPIIKNVIDQKSLEFNIEEDDKEFLCSFYSGALGSLIINWIENGMKEDVNNIINKVELLLTGNISNYLKLTKKDKCH